ncbi:tetratricopeptide repeat protein [Catenovulum agarivorans]|uniref:tetratricopeptide repeat protein n=1 Tax=Catenovulum agarivorans TaxID=1172192 RepID=UPI0002E46823|nr:hypothetical protein [Catenovulum agarivorans]
MSVINQMLKDLDSRQHQGKSADNQDYPQIPAQTAQQPQSKRKLIWSLLAVIVLVYAVWMFWPQIQQQFPQLSQIKQTEVTAPVATTQNDTKPAAPVAVAKPQKIISATLATPAAPTASNSANAKQQNTPGAQPSKLALPPAQPVNKQPQATSQKVQNVKPTVPTATAVEPPAQPADKKPSSLQIQNTQKSPEEIAYNKFERAQDLLNKGQFITAEQQIISALQLKNDFHQARILLVSMLYSGQNTSKALATLKQGIQQYPKHWDYYFIAARILNEQNQASAAWQVLSSVPNIGEVASYHTNMFQFKANLAQQLELWQPAYQVWQTLLTLNPSHAKWHLGAAICAEKAGEKTIALQHYQTVANQGGVSAASNKFVENKIMELQP